CRKVSGSPYYGVCPATEQRFFGWRLHIIDSLDGLPVAFDLLSARYHDLTAVHELTANLAPGTRVLGDEASIDAAPVFGSSPPARRTCNPIAGQMSTIYGAIALMPKPSTANWSTWVFNAFMPV